MSTKSIGKNGVILAAIAALAVPFAISGTVAAAGVEIGAAMPAFTMKDYAGKEHSLADYAGKIVVLEFSSHNCPWSRGVDSTIAKLAEKYGEKGVVFLGVDSDHKNTPEIVAEHAKKAGIPFAILKDDKNAYADSVSASRTPEMYIVNAEGKLVFHGAFDDRKVPEQAGSVNYVANALDELLAGKAVSTPKVGAWGCSINRVRGS